MTLPPGSTPDDASDRDADAASGRALESASGSAIDPSLASFLSAAAEERVEAPPPPRSLYTRVLDYSAHAAMIAGLLGFAWTVSDHVGRPVAPPPVKVAPAPTAVADATADLRRANQKMAADITALRANLEALQGAMHADKTAEQVRQLQTNLDGVRSGLASAKSETGATLAQLSSKIEHLPHAESAARLQQLAERLERMERADTDRMVTASIPPAATTKPAPLATPPVKPQLVKTMQEPTADAAKKPLPEKAPAAAAASEPEKKPAVISEWVVRDVYDGVAIVESKRGPMEVMPGVTIPGAGVVKSIDRHGGSWSVTTTKGQIAFMPLPREREQHGYYRSVPDDF